MPVDNIESMPWPDRFNTEVTNNAQFCELFLWLGETLEAVAGTKPAAKAMQALVQLPSGDRIWLNCVHPRPPAPGESDESDGGVERLARTRQVSD